MRKLVLSLIIFCIAFITTTTTATAYSPVGGVIEQISSWADSADKIICTIGNSCSPDPAPDTGTGGGAGGSWGDDSASGNPYTGGGGLTGGGGAGGSWEQQCSGTQGWYRDPGTSGNRYSSPASACQTVAQYFKQIYISVDSVTATSAMCRMQGDQWLIFKEADCACPIGTKLDPTTQKCIKDLPKCPDRYTYDETQKKCLLDPQQCLPPYTLIAGVCVAPKKPDPETKTCPMGYTLTNNQCVKDPDKPCDPAIQQCNEDGTAKCDCCEKLDTIIGNQGQQIKLHNRTNELLNQSVANQLTANLKLDKIGENTDNANKLLYAGNKQLSGQTELLKQIEKNTRPQSATSSTAPTSAPDLTKVTSRQDEQTGLLAQIRDLLKEKKDEPPPEPQNEQEQQQSKTNPLDSIKNYDISQNRINAQGQCPADKTFNAMGATFSIPMTNFCNALAMLGNVFLAIAYICGGIIVVKGAGGN